MGGVAMTFTTDRPKYAHDHACCTFLGTLFNTADGDHDLYACISARMPPVLIARHSSLAADYQAVTLFADLKQFDERFWRYHAAHPLSAALRLYLDLVHFEQRYNGHDPGDEDRS